MSQINTSPRQTTVLRLEARRPAAINMIFVDQDDNLLDLTGCTLTLVIAEPKHMGSSVMLTQLATAVELVNGTMRFDVQGDDLDLNPDVEYLFAMTLVSAEDFATSVVKGIVDVSANPDIALPDDYTAVAPPMGLTVKMLANNRITVKAFHYPDASLLTFVKKDELDEQVAALAVDGTDTRGAFDGVYVNETGLDAAVAALAVDGTDTRAAFDDVYVNEVDLDGSVASLAADQDSDFRETLDPILADTYVASPDVRILDRMTQAEYDALDPKIATTMYVIIG